MNELAVSVTKIGKLIKISAAEPERAAVLAVQFKSMYPGHLILVNTAPFGASNLHTFACAS